MLLYTSDVPKNAKCFLNRWGIANFSKHFSKMGKEKSCYKLYQSLDTKTILVNKIGFGLFIDLIGRSVVSVEMTLLIGLCTIAFRAVVASGDR